MPISVPVEVVVQPASVNWQPSAPAFVTVPVDATVMLLKVSVLPLRRFERACAETHLPYAFRRLPFVPNAFPNATLSWARSD